MKDQVRVLGIDDSPFAFGQKSVLVVGVVARLPMYVEGIMKTECSVDGNDANDALLSMINASRYKEQLRLIMIDGVALGGFNVVDISLLHEQTGVPFATITRDLPDFEKIKAALDIYFPDGKERMRVISAHQLKEVKIGRSSIWVALEGMDWPEGEKLMTSSVVNGAIPEPLRLAHLIATAMVKGESRGRA